MKECILYPVSEKQVKNKIKKRKLIQILRFIINIVLWPFRKIINFSLKTFVKIYKKTYPHASKINKTIKTIIILYCIASVAVNIGFFIYFRMCNIPKIIAFKGLLISIPIVIFLFWLTKKLLHLYSYFIGEELFLEDEILATIFFILYVMDHILKVFGITGAGKDTFMAAATSVLVSDFRTRTRNDILRIKRICYIFDFELLDNDLSNNYKNFLTNSRKKLKRNFLGTEASPGMAIGRNLYLKKYYSKLGNSLISDLASFEENPISYQTQYAYGTGVNRKHFLQIIMYEYIQWWVRENIEKNYCMANQPFVEDLNTGLMAAIFSFNFLRTRRIPIRRTNPETNKKEKVMENVFWPWKDRLVVNEAECGTLYMNVNDAVTSEIYKSGSRNLKVYHRHIMKDFYWFQNDQVPDRTAKIFRELDHGYACVLERKEIEGGRVANLWPNFLLNRYQKRIEKMEGKALKWEFKFASMQTRLDDLKELYFASSKEKYDMKYQKIKNKYTTRKMKEKYEKYKGKVSMLENLINQNKKNGYIQEVICFSKTGADPADYTIMPVNKINDEYESNRNKLKMAYVTKLTFRTSDCERYDTHFMRKLGEKLAEQTKIEFANIPRWSSNMKMTEDDIAWMGYVASKEMFGIDDKIFEEIRYGEGYKKYIDQNR